ncbi:unnamed protein product [Paramecium pentaurelia]|uniref:Ribosomal RNA-processing protein 8 n=1 Tax=Paramecium pentaurelia TaxID=43138 RepID=A0A8S1VM01_9CILI|nr:unnamed protein product [Paramecium pentaurelia]
MFGKVKRNKDVIQQNISKKNKKELKAQKKWEQDEERIKGSKFRLLNEYMYTVNSVDALKHFKQHPEEFKIYHTGYAQQIEKWPESPVGNIIKLLKESEQFQNKKLVVADLGCGQGEIQEHFDKDKRLCKLITVKSFDLVAIKPYIIETDISNLPMDDCSCDVAIFSLSLMGVNYLDYLGEAFRVLKKNGHLIIAEVKSRMNNIDNFVNLITGMGMKILKRDEHNSHFVLFVFQKIMDICQFNGPLNQKRVYQILGQKDPNLKDWQSLGQQILQPCVYKKR